MDLDPISVEGHRLPRSSGGANLRRGLSCWPETQPDGDPLTGDGVHMALLSSLLADRAVTDPQIKAAPTAT